MYTVSKEIHFCYGHRLLNYNGKCAHPHGHNGKIVIELHSDALDQRGMVHDFSDIKKAVQSWVDQELDHKMILNKNDVLVKILSDLNEPIYLMDENPTAEAMAKLIYDVCKKRSLPVAKVTFWETPSSFATFS